MKKLLTVIAMTVLMLSFALTAHAAGKVYATQDVNLRKGPGIDYSIYTSVKEGKVLTYAGQTRKDDRGVAWYKVSYKGKKLWISSKASSRSKKATTKSKNRVETTADVNLRKGPGLKYKKVTSVAKGSTFKYLGTKKDKRGVKWYKVSYNKKKLWVSSRYAVRKTSEEAKKVYTTGDLNLRKGPGVEYTAVTAVDEGTVLPYAGETRTAYDGRKWFKVTYKGQKLWISSKYSYLK